MQPPVQFNAMQCNKGKMRPQFLTLQPTKYIFAATTTIVTITIMFTNITSVTVISSGLSSLIWRIERWENRDVGWGPVQRQPSRCLYNLYTNTLNAQICLYNLYTCTPNAHTHTHLPRYTCNLLHGALVLSYLHHQWRKKPSWSDPCTLCMVFVPCIASTVQWTSGGYGTMYQLVRIQTDSVPCVPPSVLLQYYCTSKLLM